MRTKNKTRPLLPVISSLVCVYVTSCASIATEVEFDTTCWAEDFFISVYKAGIYNPNAKVDSNEYSSDILDTDSFTTRDGETLHGLVWKAKEPIGYLMVVQGNSMLAAEIYRGFQRFTELGLDVYMYDFRGYGENGSITTTLEGIVSDYVTRISQLNGNKKYKQRYVYGISFGGVVLLNAIDKLHISVDGAVFDSVPDTIPFFVFCHKKNDPIELLPKGGEACKNWLFSGAEKDNIVGEDALDLAKRAREQCGGQTFIEGSGHFFGGRLDAAKGHLSTLIQLKGG